MTKVGELELSFEHHTENVGGVDRVEESIHVSNKLGKPFFQINKNFVSGGEILLQGQMIAQYSETYLGEHAYSVAPYEDGKVNYNKTEQIHPLDYLVRLMGKES